MKLTRMQLEAIQRKASGSCAHLVEWEIEEYDGMEHVAEVHRTWS